MTFKEAQIVLEALQKFIGIESKPENIKIKKFIILPSNQTKQASFLMLYSISLWDEKGIIDNFRAHEDNYTIIAQYDLEFPNLDYQYLTTFLASNDITLIN